MALLTAFSLMSCKKAEDGYVESGELVVMGDYSDIRLGIFGIDTLNPIATKSESVLNIMNIVYEPLFNMSETGKADPVLAHSCEVSDDGKQITVELKDGVKWHDGTNFTAEDVAYTLSRMKESSGLYSKISSKIRSFTAVNKNTIVINFEESETAPQYLLTFPVISRNSSYSDGGEFTPIGTGSYKFVSKGGTEILLEPNLRWHEGNVSKRKIIVAILKDSKAVLEAFNVGQIDAVTSAEIELGGITPKTNSAAKTFTSERMVFLGFNTKSSHLLSSAVRQAVNASIDRKKIVEQDAYGQGIAAELSIDPASWVMSGEKKDEGLANSAEDIMESNGYTIRDGVYHKDDEKMTLRLLVNADNAQRAALADSIATTLRTAGFDIVVEKTSYEEYGAKITNDDFDMFIGETEVEKNLNPAAMLTGGSNYFNFEAETVKAYMRSLYNADSEEAIKRQIGEFSEMFYNNPPYLPLYFKTESVVYGSYVSGIEKPVSCDPYKDIEKWYFYDKEGKENKEKADE